MTSDEQWVRERAKVIVDLWVTEHLAPSNLEHAIAAALQDAIARTREEERAERDKAVSKMREAGERAVGRVVAAERERCARIADRYTGGSAPSSGCARSIAAAILAPAAPTER